MPAYDLQAHREAVLRLAGWTVMLRGEVDQITTLIRR
jgi:hypothetical protein